MAENLEKMARAMNVAYHGTDLWDVEGAAEQLRWRRDARAALDYLGFPPGAEPEAGAVGMAIEALTGPFEMPDDARHLFALTILRCRLSGARSALGVPEPEAPAEEGTEHE